jgi:hypothetical protein
MMKTFEFWEGANEAIELLEWKEFYDAANFLKDFWGLLEVEDAV